MIAHTVQEMISILEQYPLDAVIRDVDSCQYKFYGYMESLANPTIPSIVMTRKGLGHDNSGGSVMDLLTSLIGIMMDVRFLGPDSLVRRGEIDTNECKYSLRLSPGWESFPMIGFVGIK